MKKSDLKTGMIFEKYGGDLYQVFLNTPLGDIYVNKEGVHGFMEDLTESMNWKCNFAFIYIVNVYSPKFSSTLLSFDLSQFKLIWSREPKETIKIGKITYDKVEFEEAVKNLKPIK